jgi:hypothetical protein
MVELKLIGLLAVHLILTALPGAAAALFAARRGARNVPILLAIALVASAGIALLTFWLYFAAPVAGKAFSYLAPVASLAVFGWSLSSRRITPALLGELATPLALWALGSTFLVFLGFLHGGTDHPIAMASSRFSYPLPSDPQIPLFFANWFYSNGHHGPPPLFPGVWSASDRPPLQVGYVLSQRPVIWDNTGHSSQVLVSGLNYQVLAVVLQQLWIVGLWALLVAARLNRTTRGLLLITVLVSGLAIVNGFFVWPKMLAAAMVIAAAALVVTPVWTEVRSSFGGAALVAALLALALLGHGSSLFGIIGLVVVAAIRGLPNWRWFGVLAVVGAVLLLPWSMYQKYGDPPGNRLPKWAFAGDIGVNSRSTLQDVIDAYRAEGVGGTLHNKAENFITMAGGAPAVVGIRSSIDAAESGHLAGAVAGIRAVIFFYLLPSFGLLLLAPVLMVAGRFRRPLDSPEWQFALTCYLLLAVGELVAGLLLFGSIPARALLHENSYALPVFGFCGAVAGLRAAFPRFAVYFVLVGSLLMFALYVPALTPLPGTRYSLGAGVIAAVGLAAFVTVALRGTVAIWLPAVGRLPRLREAR